MAGLDSAARHILSSDLHTLGVSRASDVTTVARRGQVPRFTETQESSHGAPQIILLQ